MICTPYTSLEPGVRRLTFHGFSLISFGGEELENIWPRRWAKGNAEGEEFRPNSDPLQGQNSGKNTIARFGQEFGLIRYEIQGGVWSRKARALGEGTAMQIHRTQERRIGVRY